MLKVEGIVPEYVTENLMGQLIDVVFGFTGSWTRFSHTTAPYRLEFTSLPPWTHGFTVPPPASTNTTRLSCCVASVPSMNLRSPAQTKKKEVVRDVFYIKWFVSSFLLKSAIQRVYHHKLYQRLQYERCMELKFRKQNPWNQWSYYELYLYLLLDGAAWEAPGLTSPHKTINELSQFILEQLWQLCQPIRPFIKGFSSLPQTLNTPNCQPVL